MRTIPSTTNSRTVQGSFVLALAVLVAGLVGCESDTAPYQIADQQSVDTIRSEFGENGGAGGEAAPTEIPTGFATLTGRITLTGTVPQNRTLDINKERNICAPNGDPVFYPEFVVSNDGGFANVLVFLDTKLPEDDPLWLHDSAKAEPGSVVEFDQEQCMFLSPLLAFQTGQTLRILNSDNTGHNTAGRPSKNIPFNVNLPALGQSEVTTFTKSEREPFPVACSVHPWMNAHMFCRDNGYFAVTDENGNFTIPNLPAGVELDIKIWHESCEFGLSEIEIDGSTEPLSRGKWSLRLSPDEPEKSVEMVIQASQLQ